MRRLPNLIPVPCALCGCRCDDGICPACRTQFYSRPVHRCRQCALPLPSGEPGKTLCGACLRHPPSFDATVVAADYIPPTDQLVLGLKFGSQLAFAALFGQMLHAAVQRNPIELPQVLAAVPLGPKRLTERGFNQALEIAKPLACRLNIPVDKHLILRTRDTAAQAQLPPEERRSNMSRAFTVSSQSIARVQGRHIGVVDDVMTTGETLNELAATLKRFGARRVTNLVFARTLK